MNPTAQFDSQSLTLWADSTVPPSDLQHVVLWDSFLPQNAPASWVSLPEIVRESKEDLRDQYLSWLHSVENTPIGPVPLRDYLQMRPGFSYWWMSLPAENALEPDSPTYGVVRLLALSKYADTVQPGVIRLHTRRRDLILQIEEWASSTGRRLRVVKPKQVRKGSVSFSLRKLRIKSYQVFPPLEALRVLLGHLASVLWRPRSVNEPLKAHPTEICIVDYMAHLTRKAQTGGSFESRYWGPLVDYLRNTDISTLAIHFPAHPASRRQVRKDTQLKKRFNETELTFLHAVAQDAMTWKTLRKGTVDFFRIARFGRSISDHPHVFRNGDSGTSYRPLFKERFRSIFFGRDAMQNAIYLNLIEDIISLLPEQKVGLYLCENQPWEMALIHAWRQSQKGPLIGVVHSTIQFWDTRLLKNIQDVYLTDGIAGMPIPHKLAINGQTMRTRLLDAGYTKRLLKEVEALRYLHLMHVEGTSDPGALSLLILGEYSDVAEQHLVGCVDQALHDVVPPPSIVFRAHPTRPNGTSSHSASWSSTQESSLLEDLLKCRLAVCGPSSSAALDALGMGRETIIVADPQSLASSPAEGLPGISYCHSVSQLAQAIRKASERRHPVNVDLSSYFNLNAALPLWVNLIEEHSDTKGTDSSG